MRATGAGEAVCEDAALRIPAELALDVAGDRVGVIELAASQRKPSLEVSLDRAIQQRALRPPPAIAVGPLAAISPCVMLPLGTR